MIEFLNITHDKSLNCPNGHEITIFGVERNPFTSTDTLNGFCVKCNEHYKWTQATGWRVYKLPGSNIPITADDIPPVPPDAEPQP